MVALIVAFVAAPSVQGQGGKYLYLFAVVLLEGIEAVIGRLPLFTVVYCCRIIAPFRC